MSMYGNKGPYEPQYRQVAGQYTCWRCGETYSANQAHYCTEALVNSGTAFIDVKMPEGRSVPQTGTFAPSTGTMTVYPPNYTGVLERIAAALERLVDLGEEILTLMDDPPINQMEFNDDFESLNPPVCEHQSYRWDVCTNRYVCVACSEPWEKPNE